MAADLLYRPDVAHDRSASPAVDQPYGPRALGATTDAAPTFGDVAAGAIQRRANGDDPFTAATFSPGGWGGAVQRRESGEGARPPVDAITGSVGATGPGQALDGDTRGRMESSFGADFSGVRVHEGAAAGAMGAQAFTQGQDVHFAPGQYQPGTPSGDSLIGHELAHVVQQQQGRVAVPQGKGAPINDDPALEAEADRAGEQAARGERAEVAGSTSGMSGAPGAVQAKVAAPVQCKSTLKMTAGYTEALNWSSEAKTLIATWDQFETLWEQIEGKNLATVVGSTFKGVRARTRKLDQFRKGMLGKTIPNDHAKRELETQAIEGEIAKAKTLLSDYDRIANVVPPTDTPKEGELNGAEMSNDVETDLGRKDVVETSGESSHFLNPNTKVEGPENAPEYGPQPQEKSTTTKGLEAIEIKILDVNQLGVTALQKLGYQDVDQLKVEKQGRLGSVSGELGGGLKATGGEGVNGSIKGQVKMLMGKGAEVTTDTVDLVPLFLGGKVAVRGKGEVMGGVKSELSGEGSLKYDSENGLQGGLKGGASAFVGTSLEVSPQVKIVDGSGKQLSAVTLTGGMSFGLGGSYEGEISFANGVLTYKSKGTMTAGVGLTWGVAAEININSMIAKLLGY